MLRVAFSLIENSVSKCYMKNKYFIEILKSTMKRGINLCETNILRSPATTPLHEEVLNEMLPFFRTNFGNASSVYKKGVSPEKQ